MKPRIKLLLLIPHLGGGGAERVMGQLARHLDCERFEVHLGLMVADFPGAMPPPPRVEVHRLGVRRVREAWLPLIGLVRELRPDAILSGMAHLNFLVLLLKPFFPSATGILVRQNTTASAAASGLLARLSYRVLYPRADRVICQSEAMARDLKDNFDIPCGRIAVLANPIDSPMPKAGCEAASVWPRGSSPRLLTVGRLAHEKGLDLLLGALVGLRSRFPKLHAILVGSGPGEQRLRDLCRELHLEDSVSFAGHCDEVADYYREATLFLQPSRYEGMPNALLEAAAAGLPLMATPSAEGVVELLKGCPGTWVSSEISVQSVALTMQEALEALATGGRPLRFEHGFLARFEAEKAVAAYAALIEEVAERRRP